MSKPFYIDSTTPGKAWSVHAGKNLAGFVVGSATEGELKRENGFDSFGFAMFQARTEFAQTQSKRMTSKAEDAAIEGVIAKLAELGYSTGTNV